MSCNDGFAIALPTAHMQKFMAHARHFDPLSIELAAIPVIEGWDDDVPGGNVSGFRRAVQARAEDRVAFAWVEWPDQATRDAAMKKRAADPRMDPSTPGRCRSDRPLQCADVRATDLGSGSTPEDEGWSSAGYGAGGAAACAGLEAIACANAAAGINPGAIMFSCATGKMMVVL